MEEGALNQYRRLERNILLQAVGRFSTRLMLFLLTPLYTSILSTGEYGTVDYLIVTVSLVYPIITLIIPEAEVRFLLDGKNREEVWAGSLFISAVGFLLLFLLSPALQVFAILKTWYGYFMWMLFSYLLYELCVHYAIGIDRFAVVSAAGVINTAVMIACNICFLALLQWGVRGYLLSFIAGYALAAIYILLRVRPFYQWKNPLKIHSSLYQEMLAYSIPLVPNSVAWWVNNSADKYMIEFFCGAGELGLLSVAYKIPSALSMLNSVFVSAWKVSSVNQLGSDENVRFFQTIYSVFLLLISTASFVLILLTKELARFLFRMDFFAAWRISPLLIYAFFFQSLASFLGSVYTAHKKTNIIFYSTLLGAAVNIICNAILIPYWGGVGAAGATIIGPSLSRKTEAAYCNTL